jgi:hypothetical protein
MNRLVFAASILVLVAACGSSDETPGPAGSAGGAGGTVNAGGSSGTGGIAAGGGGVSAGGSSGAGGTAAGAGGQTVGAGGQAAGAAGSPGSGGQAAGAGGAQAGGAAGQVTDAAVDAPQDSAAPVDGPAGDGGIAGGLNGLRILMPCTAAPKTENGEVCATTPQIDKQSYSIAVGGDPTKTYDVQVRVRGVVETMTYTGGAVQTAISPHYYVGGTKVDGTFNIYSIKVPDPAQVYYFNAAPATSHTLFTVDYVVTISMKGGTTITAGVDGQNGLEITNKGNLTLAGITGITQPYDGQFLQFDVVSVTAK